MQHLFYPVKVGAPQPGGNPYILPTFQSFQTLERFSSQGLRVKWDMKAPPERAAPMTSQDSSLQQQQM